MYIRSVRPPSLDGGDHVRVMVVPVTEVFVRFRGALGGAVRRRDEAGDRQMRVKVRERGETVQEDRGTRMYKDNHNSY